MSREAFEAWWEKEGQFCRAGGGDYEKTFAFRAYEAATAAALDEAARKVENYCGAWDDEGYALAMEIRALKEKE